MIISSPQLTFIMLNPGSCESVRKDFDEEVDVHPDASLNRIIKLLEESNNIKHCRVLNISDVREYSKGMDKASLREAIDKYTEVKSLEVMNVHPYWKP